ncbi:hypothetical protein [Pseudacidovorax intermedius]|uniref:Uncharacterized protein n=1 Tax=Pseudacidovorax intermedius TaxID=433924 RepID=A0A147GP22_9BURK|nr:hypothetical protein [Pseudacidovorax intermedius]KTT15837.1 hypothetical protein NS331_19450 [Pseudacidovorax intermedius]
MKLEIYYPSANPEQLQAALTAAMAVFEQADVDPYDAWLAWAEAERWGETGYMEAFRPSDEYQRLIDLTSQAQVAANEVLGVPPGEVVTLDFVDG